MIRWVTAFLDRPEVHWDRVRDFWLAATGSTSSTTRGEHDEFVTLVPMTGDACLRMQRTLDGSASSHHVTVGRPVAPILDTMSC